MNTTTTRLVIAFAILFLIGLSTSAPAQVSRTTTAQLLSAKDRTSAPVLTLPDERGKQVRLSDYRGKVLLLDFWATDCGGCRLEIPGYIQLQAAYKDKGLAVVGVSMDIWYEDLKTSKDAWNRVDPFAKQQKINYTILMADGHTSDAYRINSLPATYLVDRNGRIAASYIGVIANNDNVEKNIQLLLAEH